MKIRSMTGRDATAIYRDAGSTEHRVFRLTHPDALVEGFTISNGYMTAPVEASHGGGSGCRPGG